MKRTLIGNSERSPLSVWAVVGLSPRYHKGECPYSICDFNRFWQEEAQSHYNETGVYVSVITSESYVIYREDSGCPFDGELSVDVRADCNPYYWYSLEGVDENEYVERWKNIFLQIIENVAEKLNQTTVTVKFSNGELLYLTKN